MKKIITLTIMLFASASFIACSSKEDTKNKPDTVYRQTTENPALGADATLGHTAPISDSINTSLDLFSSKKDVKTEKQNAMPQNVEEKSVAKIENNESNKQDAADDNNDDTATEAEVTEPQVTLSKAPRIKADEIAGENPATPAATAPIAAAPAATAATPAPADNEKEEPVDEAKTATPAPANAPAEKEVVLNNLDTRPVDSMKVTSLEEAKADKETATADIEQPVQTEAKPVQTADNNEDSNKKDDSIFPVIPKKTTNRTLPASMYYKAAHQDQTNESADDTKMNVNHPKGSILSNLFGKNDKKAEAKAEAANGDELPPVDSVKVGQCYAKATILGETKEVEDNVLVKEASKKTIDVPAEYKEVEEDVVVKEAATRMVNVPATYKTVEELVVVTPEKTEEIIVSPAQYKTVTEKVLVHPAQKIWKDEKGNGVMKLVEEPEEYNNVTKKVLVAEEKRETRTTPAVTKTVKKQILDQEAHVEKQTIPAETKKIKKQVLVSDATTQTIEIPAQYRTEKKRVQTGPDKQQWMPVICGDALNRDTIKRVQGALVAKGFNLKDVDGVEGKETVDAVNAYQGSLGFKIQGITIKTLETLGLQQ